MHFLEFYSDNILYMFRTDSLLYMQFMVCIVHVSCGRAATAIEKEITKNQFNLDRCSS